jgi:hypothetical protein
MHKSAHAAACALASGTSRSSSNLFSGPSRPMCWVDRRQYDGMGDTSGASTAILGGVRSLVVILTLLFSTSSHQHDTVLHLSKATSGSNTSSYPLEVKERHIHGICPSPVGMDRIVCERKPGKSMAHCIYPRINSGEHDCSG